MILCGLKVCILEITILILVAEVADILVNELMNSFKLKVDNKSLNFLVFEFSFSKVLLLI